MTTRHLRAETELWTLTIVASGEAVAGVYFPEHRRGPADDEIGPATPADALLAAAAAQLDEYLRGERRSFDLPLAPAADEFARRIRASLRAIPYGETTTYGAIAASLGAPGLAQRVGQAVGRNPLSIVVPCHRVVGADGALTGFAGGLDAKRRLLALEEPPAERAGRLF